MVEGSKKLFARDPNHDSILPATRPTPKVKISNVLQTLKEYGCEQDEEINFGEVSRGDLTNVSRGLAGDIFGGSIFPNRRKSNLSVSYRDDSASFKFESGTRRVEIIMDFEQRTIETKRPKGRNKDSEKSENGNNSWIDAYAVALLIERRLVKKYDAE